MTTFDQILPKVADVLRKHVGDLSRIGPIYVNRDLNGKVRLVVGRAAHSHEDILRSIAEDLAERLGSHAFPAESAILYEDDPDVICSGAANFPLEGFENVRMVDRLAMEGNWASMEPVSPGAPRIVFFSIKGGVGRSTALAACAWSLAQAGKRVLVLDIDLESPGLSSALLPKDRRPAYGIADWLVEDLVDNGDDLLADMFAISDISHDGEIRVVPAYGREPGEYLSKLGRVWMPKVDNEGGHKPWSKRLSDLVERLEARLLPDVILIDSRAGIDEVASSCVTGLGATLVLLFAIDGEQTWAGYRILFQHWLRSGVAQTIRERLQLVGAMIPELGAAEYFEGLRERGYELFADNLYEEIPADAVGGEWSFEETDEGAPHFPWGVRWHRGFAALRSIHARLEAVDPEEVRAVFGPLVDGIGNVVLLGRESHE
ncbi:MAG: AAA family ATPase [Magnetospirillum sp. WYHS-4]